MSRPPIGRTNLHSARRRFYVWRLATHQHTFRRYTPLVSHYFGRRSSFSPRLHVNAKQRALAEIRPGQSRTTFFRRRNNLFVFNLRQISFNRLFNEPIKTSRAKRCPSHKLRLFFELERVARRLRATRRLRKRSCGATCRRQTSRTMN